MKLLLTALTALAVPPSAQSMFEGESEVGLGRDFADLELHNGTDVLWLIQSPFVGAPVSDFDPTGDLYWKVFPAEALRRCEGASDLMGIEAVVYDTDWISTEALWAYTVSPGVSGTDGTILPTFGGRGVFVPGLSTTGAILGAPGGGCAAPGYISGWTYDEVFFTTAGVSTPLLELDADGSTDWVFAHYFPAPGLAPHDTSGAINSCGSTGDLTLQWGGSTDGTPTPSSTGGENQPDWTGFGNSIYGGFNIGGSGSFVPIPEDIDGGAELNWLFEKPVLTVVADAGDGFGPERGTAALQTPLQVSSSGLPGPGTTTLGARLTVADADPSHVMIAALNAGPTLLELGLECVDLARGQLALNPADPAFAPSAVLFGAVPFTPNGERGWHAETPRFSAGTSPAWVDLTLSWQAWQFDLATSRVVGTSQVFQNTLRTYD